VRLYVRVYDRILRALHSLQFCQMSAHSALQQSLNIQTNENAYLILKNTQKWLKYCKTITLLSGMNVQWPINIHWKN